MQEIHQDSIKNFYINNWKTFRQVWKSTQFVNKFKEQTLEQIRQVLKNNFHDLIDDKKSLCYLFPDSLKKEHIDIIIQIVKSQQFCQELDYDFEAMYFGKKKQMLIYQVTNRSLINYLSKYRLPSKYTQIFDSVNKGYEQYRKKLIQKNVLISKRCSKEQINRCSEQIEEMRKFKFGKTLQLFSKYFQSLLKDFVSQPKKLQILVQKANSEIRKQISKLCQNMDLKINDRYYDNQLNLETKDIIINKTEYQSNDQNLSEESQQIDPKQITNATASSQNLKSFEITKPKNISAVKIQAFKKEGVFCRIQLKPSGTANRPQYLKISIKYPKKINYQKIIPISEDEISSTIIQTLLQPVNQGYTEYCLTTSNQAGESADMIVKIWIDLIQIGEKKQRFLKKYNNELYILGENQEGLIFDPKENSDLCHSTNGKWKQLIGCTDFSVSNHAVICNRDGDCAGWGKMYCFGEDPNLQNYVTEEESIQDTAFNFIRPYYFRIEKLSLIFQEAFIRKISCGDSYCLMSSSFGQVYSFGLNNFGQLGIGHADQTFDTSEPQLVNKLSLAFIKEVVATNYGKSFAIDSKGRGYRWGLNQIQSSPTPVYDTFSNIINFEYGQIILSQHIPLPLTSKLIDEPIKQIGGGRDFSFALTENNILYGWGNMDFLGIDKIQNRNFQKIANICNPIQIMKNIQSISIGSSHCLALTDKKELIGWGQSEFLGSKEKSRWKLPKVIIESFSGQFFLCGTCYSVIQTVQGVLEVFGNHALSHSKHTLPEKTSKIAIGNGVIMAMCEKLI